jgi:predicted nucleic acid-binding protein
MPEKTKTLVINTGPIIALVAALGNLSILKELYKKVIVPYEVSQSYTITLAKLYYNFYPFRIRNFFLPAWKLFLPA